MLDKKGANFMVEGMHNDEEEVKEGEDAKEHYLAVAEVDGVAEE